MRTYTKEGEHDGHVVWHQHQLTAVASTWSRDLGPIGVQIHLIFLNKIRKWDEPGLRKEHQPIVGKSEVHNCIILLCMYLSLYETNPQAKVSQQTGCAVGIRLDGVPPSGGSGKGWGWGGGWRSGSGVCDSSGGGSRGWGYISAASCYCHRKRKEKTDNSSSVEKAVFTGRMRHIAASALTVCTPAAVNHKSLYEDVWQCHVDHISLNQLFTLARVAGVQVYTCNLGLCSPSFSD